MNWPDKLNNYQLGGPNGDCWLWLGGKHISGYGHVYLEGKTYRVHRIAYQTAHPDVDTKGKLICHTCDVRSCMNPSHLYAGSAKDNARDREIRRRGNRPVGEQCSWSKLSEQDVLKIKSLGGAKTQQALADEFGVSQTCISLILRGKRWNSQSQTKPPQNKPED